MLRMKEESKKNYTYILTCADGTYYCGWTNDLDKRLAAHNGGRGAKYTRSRGPVKLVYWETWETKEEALRREAAIKKMSRSQKLQLIGTGPGPAAVRPPASAPQNDT